MKPSQGRRLIALLKRRYYTCMQLHEETGAPTSWHKTIGEFLRDHESLESKRGRDGLKRYRVVAAKRLTA